MQPRISPQTNTAPAVRPLDAAPDYIALGWPVLPCQPGTKRPLTAHGWHDATTAREAVADWRRRFPDANIAIATGPAGLVVIDLDPRHGGFATWGRLDVEHGPISTDTLTVHTPSGGVHRYYRAPAGVIVPSSVGRLGLGVDVRAAGGYVVAPPSRLPSGSYRWDAALWFDGEPAPLPPALLALIGQATTRTPGAPHARIPAVIHEGAGRNMWMARMAGSLRRWGLSGTTIHAALEPVNEAHCRPPLAANELRRIALGMERYAPADEAASNRRRRRYG